MSDTQTNPGAALLLCGWAPGNYWETCIDCKARHIAAKWSCRCQLCAEKEVERRHVEELERRQPAKTQPDELDALAKIMADRIGHGMREKCVPHARAAIEAGYTRNAEARIQGLLEANNAEVERRRAAEAQLAEADEALANLKAMGCCHVSLWALPGIDKAAARHAERMKAGAGSRT